MTLLSYTKIVNDKIVKFCILVCASFPLINPSNINIVITPLRQKATRLSLSILIIVSHYLHFRVLENVNFMVIEVRN